MLPYVAAAGVTKLPSVFAVPVLRAASPALVVYLGTMGNTRTGMTRT